MHFLECSFFVPLDIVQCSYKTGKVNDIKIRCCMIAYETTLHKRPNTFYHVFLIIDKPENLKKNQPYPACNLAL